ncbi:MAG: oligosaccharide flippase family protein [Candidatus Eisenbacteria bacterium]|nr:oligosaccharide flippase family protein [Candidatus Eisenbacteria bacterium]
MQTSREVPSALAWSVVSKLLVSILALVSNVLIVRGLGDHDYGVYSLYLNIARFLAPLIGLGLAQAVLQFLPELRVRADARGTRQLLLRTVGLQLFTWLAVVGLVYLLRGQLSTLLKTDLRTILLLGTLLLICEVLWNSISHVFMALRRMQRLTLASVLQRAALIVLLLLLLLSGLTIPRVLYAVAGSFLVGILILGPGLRRGLGRGAEATGEGLALRRMLRYALPIAVGAVINQILWRSSETLVIGYYWPAEQVGYFNAAYNLPQMILEFVPLAIWPIMLASLSEVHAQRAADLARGIRLYFRLLFILVVPFALTGFVLGAEAYRVLYGAQMAPGAPICQALFLVFLLAFFTTPLRMALYVKERALLNTGISAVGAVINLVLDFVFIPRYGIWGGVWPVAIALGCTGVLQYVCSKRLLPEIEIPWSHFLRVLTGAAVILPLWWLRPHLGAPLPLAGALIGGTLLQFLLLRQLRVLGEEERSLLLRSNLPLKRWLTRLLAP